MFPNNHLYFINMAANLADSLHDPDVGQMAGAYSGWPGVICSAGPSLAENLRACSHLHRTVIFCVDAALPVLLRALVVPTYVLTCDAGQTAASKYLTNFPNSTLIYDVSAWPAVREATPWRLVVSQANASFANLYAITGRTLLPYWGCVSSMALAVAARMGCNPIFFLGQDFAFRPSPNGRLWSHDAGSPAGYEIDRKHPELRQEFGASGQPQLTTETLRQYRDYMNRQVRDLSGKAIVVNATGDGIFSGTHEQSKPVAVGDYLRDLQLVNGFPSVPASNWKAEDTAAVYREVESIREDPVRFGPLLSGIALSTGFPIPAGSNLFLPISKEHKALLDFHLALLSERLRPAKIPCDTLQGATDGTCG
jgi:hypothetical protein